MVMNLESPGWKDFSQFPPMSEKQGIFGQRNNRKLFAGVITYEADFCFNLATDVK
jgi:hypothetical protein